MLEKRDGQRIVYDSTCFDSVFIEQKEKIGIDKNSRERYSMSSSERKEDRRRDATS